MNNAELADKVAAANPSLTKADARKVVDGALAAIVDAVASGDEVSLSGFGKFKRKQSAAREGRNPRTGEAMPIAAKNSVGFSPAKAVKDKLNA